MAIASSCPRSASAEFNADSILELNPQLVGPSITQNQGIIGEGVDLNLSHRRPALFHDLFHASRSICSTPNGAMPGRSQNCTSSASSSASPSNGSTACLVCTGGTYPAQVLYQELADMACERITHGITASPSAQAAGQSIGRPLQPDGLHGPRQLHHLETRPLGDRRPPLPYQLGDSRQRLGGRVLPRGRVASPRASPTSRITASVLRSPIATARKSGSTGPTSSCCRRWARGR